MYTLEAKKTTLKYVKQLSTNQQLHINVVTIQWYPIQMRHFHSNESCQLAPILLELPLFLWWKERGKIDHIFEQSDHI